MGALLRGHCDNRGNVGATPREGLQIVREFDTMRSDRPLPPITGPVDAISNIQGSVMAAGLDYQPRPTV